MTIPLVATYAPVQFSLWRALFGIYLLFYAIREFPYRYELYTSVGMLPDPVISYIYGYLPNFLNVFDSPETITLVFAVLFLSVICIIIGFFRLPNALITWLILSMLFGRNVLTEDPSLPFTGLLLIFLCIIPSREPLSTDRFLFGRRGPEEWYMPWGVYWGAWFVLGLSFTASGIDRLFSETWQNGTAMYYILHQPIAFDYWFVHYLQSLPHWTIAGQTWAAASTYTLSLPLIFWERTRSIIWLLWVLMFIYVLATLDLTEVVLGMLLYFLFLFDSRWIPDAIWKHISEFSRSTRKLAYVLMGTCVLAIVILSGFFVSHRPTIVLETQHLPELSSHPHVAGDSAIDKGHHYEIYSPIYTVPDDVNVSEIEFEIHNAPDIILHHALLVDIDKPDVICPQFYGRELAAVGQDQMHTRKISLPQDYALTIIKGTRLQLAVALHNPLPPIGPGGTFEDVFATVKLKSVSNPERATPVYFHVLKLDEDACASQTHVFTVPPHSKGYVYGGPGWVEKGQNRMIIEHNATIVYMGAHLHGWQSGKNVAIRRNGELLSVFETVRSNDNPYRYDTPHYATEIALKKEDVLSIEAVYDNGFEVPIRGAMGMFGMYVAPTE
ncbi:hypothetical protein HY969_03320 [Candidatus Kaiserbacteria bacterium]|nr:hypothetical protein [Candidatus Kaiserbacteria bacterium]